MLQVGCCGCWGWSICQVFVLLAPLLGEMHIPLNYPADPYHDTLRHVYTQPGESPGSLFAAETSSYCDCNLHCNFGVASDACVAHPAWTKHKLSAREGCAVGAQRAGYQWGVPSWAKLFSPGFSTPRRKQRMGTLPAEKHRDTVSVPRDSCLTERKKTTAGERLSAKGRLEGSWS